MGADGLGQVGQRLRVKAFPGLLQTRFHLGDGEGDGAAFLVLKGGIPQQGAQALAQALAQAAF